MRSDLSTGERIAAWRVYRGMTQEACAGLVGKSLSWWKKVEAGVRHVEKLTDLITIGQVLRVSDLADLTGVARFSLAVDSSGEHPMLPPVKAAFNAIPPTTGGEPPDRVNLRHRLDAGWHVWHTSAHFHSRVGEFVPALVQDAERLLFVPPPDRRDAYRLRADCYGLVRGWLRKVCAYDLARIAAERQLQSALRADDPVRTGLAAFGLTGVLTHQSPEEGLEVSMGAIRMLDRRVDADTSDGRDGLGVWGALNLSASIAAARSGEDGRAWGFLDRAQDAASTLGPDYWCPATVFGHANVSAYAVAVPVELGKSRDAVTAAERRFDPTALPSVERRARSLVDVARGYAARRDDVAAIKFFEMAVRESAEEVRSCLVAHSTIQEMLRRDKRAISQELRALARQVGVLEST
ncbi:MAG TPA: helix-turn-helix domain-containing protein [Mycobacteriales bacterium]|nr:helix-turn-helix domain-containing protein [Mycobacteriales bacterium]